MIDNAKSQKTGTETRRIIQIPIYSQFKSLREAHEVFKKENNEKLKVIKNLKIQVALLVHERSSKTTQQESKESKESQTIFYEVEELTCKTCNYQGENE